MTLPFRFLSTCLGGAPPNCPGKLVVPRKNKEDKPLVYEGKTPQDLFAHLKPPETVRLFLSFSQS